MKLTITTLDDHILNIEVSDELELENLKAQCEFELGIPSASIVFTWNGRPLHDNKKTLRDYGIPDGDMLLLQQVNRPPSQMQQPQASSSSGQRGAGGLPQLDFSSIAIPGNPPPVRPDLEDPKVILELIKNNPHERALLKERNPPLSDALESGNIERFIQVYTKQREERLKKESERNRILTMDPFDPEAQKLIAEEIRLKNVESNMESAIEFVPESFGQVVMLYVDCIVNGHPVKAFVDSGAQMTIMSQACAERCNIMRLVDVRWAGIAKGVGTQKIIGRVHLGLIQIGQDFLQSSFSILENQPMDMLLGLDMLKRHQCVIDLQKNELIIGTTGTRTKFLPENQLPAHARINSEGNVSMDTDADAELAKALQKSVEEASGSSNTSTANRSNSQQLSQQTLPQSQAGAAASSNISNAPLPNLPSLPTPLPSTPSAPLTAPSAALSRDQTRPQGASGTDSNSFSEDVMQRLVSQGYTRDNVLAALTEAHGDVDKATMILFAKSFQM